MRTVESIIVDNHIEKNPVVAERLKLVFEKEATWTLLKALLDTEISEATSNLIKAKKVNSDLDKLGRSLWSQLRRIPEIERLPPKTKDIPLLKAGKILFYYAMPLC